MNRELLEQVEGAEGDLRPVLAWLAGGGLVADDERRGAVRRAMLLLAAGGDPHRVLDLDARAVTALAAELDRPERHAGLAGGLGELRAESDGLPRAEAALAELAANPNLAWRAYAAGLLAEELGE